MKIKVYEMYKKLRPFYADAILNEVQYFILYKPETNELEILNLEQMPNDYENHCASIHENITLKDIFQQINDYVKEYQEYLRNERINKK